MITFKIGQSEISLEQIKHVDARFVIAEHPETHKPALFIRLDECKPFNILDKLKLRVELPMKLYNGITYYDLKEKSDGKETGGSEDAVLLRGSRNA